MARADECYSRHVSKSIFNTWIAEMTDNSVFTTSAFRIAEVFVVHTFVTAIYSLLLLNLGESASLDTIFHLHLQITFFLH